MKRLNLLGLAVIILLVGCRSTPEPARPKKVVVQMIEIACDPALMEGAWPSRIWFMDLATLRNVEIKDDPSAYICEMNLSKGMGEQAYTNFYDARPISAAVERIRNLPAVKTAELPPIHLSAGGRGIDDDSEIIELPVDYDVVDGETGVTMKDDFTIGRVIEIELLDAGADRASIETSFHLGKMRGYDQYTLSNGDEIQLPWFEFQSRDTEYSLPYDTWIHIGGLVIEPKSGGKESETVQMLYLKIMRP